MQTFSLARIQSMLGLSRTVITRLIELGFVQPQRGARQELRFTFQDMVLLRTAHSLQAANIPPRKILRSLQRLKNTLPAELPLSGLRITAVGNEIAVREGDAHWHAESGQRLFDFELQPGAARDKDTVRVFERVPAEPPPAAAAQAVDPQSCFDHAVALEPADAGAAEAAYRQAIAAAPHWADPYLNLGALLCEAGRCEEAVAVYDEGVRQGCDEALLHFNRGVALEDLGRSDDALVAYGQALRLDAQLADAHYNVARLHEQRGRASEAIRHYSAYRRLTQGGRG